LVALGNGNLAEPVQVEVFDHGQRIVRARDELNPHALISLEILVHAQGYLRDRGQGLTAGDERFLFDAGQLGQPAKFGHLARDAQLVADIHLGVGEDENAFRGGDVGVVVGILLLQEVSDLPPRFVGGDDAGNDGLDRPGLPDQCRFLAAALYFRNPGDGEVIVFDGDRTIGNCEFVIIGIVAFNRKTELAGVGICLVNRIVYGAD